MKYETTRSSHPLTKWMQSDRSTEEFVLHKSKSKTQAGKIKQLLLHSDWAELKDVISVGGAQYNARIYELRNGLYDGRKYFIENKRENGTTWFRLEGSL